jgi:hypothetical protein
MAWPPVGEPAVSLGSKTQRGNRAACDLLQERLFAYAQGVVWFDTPAVSD